MHDIRRAAIYARFSTDLQKDRSIDDQIALCREYAAKNRLHVVEQYSDKARSGASLFGRDGLLSLMEAAREGHYQTLIVEALDRLSRDQEDLAGIYKRLSFAGVEIIAVHDGTADAIQIGIRGLVSTLFLTDLKHKIRRGMTGVISDGRHAGGRAYGYRPMAAQPGVLEIVDDEAQTVERIFTEYADGSSARDIAGGLNRDGILPPRGASWNASTILGSAARGSGILRNQLYAGRLIWNRVRMVRDPDTGKRVSRLNDPSQYRTADVPHLALISPKLFEAVQTRLGRRAAASKAGEYVRRPKRLLSGLLRCSHCGGGMSVHDRRGAVTRIKCSRTRESGNCTNTNRYHLERIERAIIEGLKTQLDNPALILEYVRTYREERMRDARQAVKQRGTLERRLASVKGQIERYVTAIGDASLPLDTIKERLGELVIQRDDLTAKLAEAPQAPVIELHPQAVERYRASIETLATRFSRPDQEFDTDAIAAFRDLIDHVVVHDGENGRVEAEVIGRLTAILGHPAGDWGGAMVAEEGLEPPTRGL
ncbi:MAG TPA: recombinase family protein [Pelagibacterium sp.]|uniref:recombinase family protein n=1 Tax=Pelagibacterium sp. TaxID=1967288 RepID=UPI002BFF3EDA|nr:recombinase family protein [Pelagibacterium sp.]HWJ86898.1 recombinase family protein [Pelagibacterium sp.]